MLSDLDFTADQHSANDAIKQWLNSDKQTFALSGLAGTGKSYLISYIQDQINGSIVCAPTGKAAYVQRQNGVEEACTLHSLIYSCKERDGKRVFEKKGSIGADLVIVDEAGMVGQKENSDLLSFNKKVLYVGDHGQLEPIGDNPNLMANPDAVLETIHRQAASSPILRLAMAFREGRESQVIGAMREKGWYRDPTGKITVTFKKHAKDLIGPTTQVICGYNNTRHRMNQEIRTARGYTKPYPEPGEPVICLDNRNKFDMFNGQVATVLGINRAFQHHIDLWLGVGEGDQVPVTCLREQFGKNTLPNHRDKGVLLLDWAYALTCHKCQGSGFTDVLVMEEVSDNWNIRRWRYTSVTRAKEKLVYCF